MGTWATIATSEMPDEHLRLFEIHFGPNTLGLSRMYANSLKDLSATGLVDIFACNLAAIGHNMRPVDGWHSPVFIGVMCSETEPIAVVLKPGDFSVTTASGVDREHIEFYAERLREDLKTEAAAANQPSEAEA